MNFEEKENKVYVAAMLKKKTSF